MNSSKQFALAHPATLVATCALMSVAACDHIDPDLLRELGQKGEQAEQGQKGEKGDPKGPREIAPDASFAWTPAKFAFPADAQSCDGAQFVRYDERYKLYVGLVGCGDGAVRVYLSPNGKDDFVPAADTAGHGQDHCELVNPQFRLPPQSEDDINSGGCKACSTGKSLPLEGVATYSRAIFGESFQRVERSPTWSHQVSRLNCGVDVQSGAGDVGGAAQVEMNCKGSYPISGFSKSSKAGATSMNPEVHVLGVYETRSDHSYKNHPTGKAVVRFARKAPSVLVLTSYEPTAWTVVMEPGSGLQKVVVSGYHEQTVNVNQDVQTEIHSVVKGDAAPYAYAHPTSQSEEVLLFAAERGGGEPMSFHGCYVATEFTVR